MPRVAFTAKFIRSLKGAQGRRVAYHDAVMPGLELRVSARGVRSWSVRCYLAGRQIRVSLGRVERVGLAVARAKARDALERAGRGEDPRRPRAGRLTVETLGRAVLKAIDIRQSTRTEWERLLRVVIVPGLGKVPADQLDRQAIRRWVESIKAPSVARGAFDLLRRCYSWGVERELLKGTPFVNLPEPRRLPDSTRVLTTDELRCVWLALTELEHQHAEVQAQDVRLLGNLAGSRRERKFVDATRLLILTASRRGMVVGMRCSELEALDSPAARWIIPAARMKGNRDHVVPLSPQAQAIIKRRLAICGEVLFPHGWKDQPMGWSSYFMRDLKAQASVIAQRELPPWRLHEFRHTAATHMVEDLGVASEVVSLILAHRPPGSAVTRVYQRAERLQERREALTRWAAWVEAL